MISTTCRWCGSDFDDPSDVECSRCGMPATGEAPANEVAEAPPRASSLSLSWLFVVGSIIVGVVSVTVIVTTLLSATLRSPTAIGSDPTTTLAGAGTIPWPTTPNFDPPLAGPVTIESPILGELGRYHLGEGIVTFKLVGDFCGRDTGSNAASGVITNFSMAQQTFDFVIEVDLIRAWNRARIGHLTATIEGVAPLQSAPWSVEMVSSQVTTLDCEITALTLIPVP